MKKPTKKEEIELVSAVGILPVLADFLEDLHFQREMKMKVKLYKTEKENYVLVDTTKGTYDDGYTLGTSRESQYNKLSLKNCQAIENGYYLDDSLSNFQSLQQTEWDVEIEMEFVEEEQTGTHLVWGRTTPKLDADGCLILKKI